MLKRVLLSLVLASLLVWCAVFAAEMQTAVLRRPFGRPEAHHRPYTLRSETVAIDEGGTRWTLSGEEGQTRPLSRHDPLLQQVCPGQTPGATGLEGSVVYLKTFYPYQAPNASIALSSDNEDFTVHVAVQRDGGGGSAEVFTKVDWIRGNEIVRAAKHLTLEFPGISDPTQTSQEGCSLKLNRDWFRTQIRGETEPKGDIPDGAMKTIWLGPGWGSTGIFILNVTRAATQNPPSESSDSAPSEPSQSSSQEHNSESNRPPGESGVSTTATSISTSTTTSSSYTQPDASEPTTSGPAINSPAGEPRKVSLVAVAIPVAVAAIIAVGLSIWCLLRRRRMRRALVPDAIGAPSESSLRNGRSLLVDVGDCEASFSFRQDKVDHFLQVHEPRARLRDSSHPSTTTGTSFSGFSEDSADGEDIVKAARRAGIPTQALLRSLGRMVPEQSDVESIAPPGYAHT